jgi:hypothetical protein
MPEVSGAADQPRGFPPALPPLPPLPAAAGITGWRSWWEAAIGLAWKTWRAGGVLPLAWTVLTALPAAGIIACVAVTSENAAGHSALTNRTFPWQVLLIPVVLLVPFVIAGGYVVARAWTGAAWVTALRAAGLPESTSADASGVRGPGVMNYARRCGLLWAAYLAGVAVLCVVAAIAGDRMTNDMLVRTTLTSVGPLGLLGPLILLVPGQLYAGRPKTAGPGPGRRAAAWRLTALVIAVLAYELAVGAALSPMVNAARVLGLLGVLIAFTLSLPATLLLAAAGQITYATRHTPGAPPDPGR